MASQSDELSTRADMAGEKPIESFKASRGPYYGFNGVYVYLVTDKSLWQSRSRAFELFGGPRRIERWPIGECGARVMKDAVIELQTPERRVKIKLDANQSAEEIVRVFQAHHS